MRERDGEKARRGGVEKGEGTGNRGGGTEREMLFTEVL